MAAHGGEVSSEAQPDPATGARRAPEPSPPRRTTADARSADFRSAAPAAEPLQLVIGRIGKAHGIKGEVTVEVRTDDPEERFAPGAVLRTDPPERGPLTIESGHVHSGRLLLAFEGVHDRNAAEALRNTLLVAEVDPAETPDDPDEFYDHQLIGLRVHTVDGRGIGAVADMLHLPGQDVIAVRPDGAGPRRTEILVPFVASIVPRVDLEAGLMVIDPPPGLLDLAETPSTSDPAGGGTGPATGPEE